MLIDFSVQNWMSFRERTTLSMLASAERQHSERLARVRRYRMRVLPVAVLFGGNASGKTNLVAALAFAQEFVTNGTRPDDRIPVQPFRLDVESIRQPTRFSFGLLINEYVYEYSFDVSYNRVVAEKLTKISTASERTLFDRRFDRIRFDTRLSRDDFLRFAFDGTRDNQLFLTNSVSQNVEHFRHISDWFRTNLKVVGPAGLPMTGNPLDDRFREQINRKLSHFDTGIEELASKDIPLDALPLPDAFVGRICNSLNEGQTKMLPGPFGNRYSVARVSGNLQARKLLALHRSSDGTHTSFDIALESDGTRRLIDLLPGFIDLSAPEARTVYIIDALDQSLHTMLSRKLVSDFLLDRDEESRSQLIIVTHDAQLMDQGLFRRDEMWATERLRDGTTRLVPFSQFKEMRNDKNVRKSYLEGRLGGVPHIVDC